jgi:3-phosphoshikimate 1-carboxyvinyltransferase
MKRIIEPLELMGARVEADNGRPPLRINGSGALKRIQYELPVASAQVKSCILLAALTAAGRTEVVEKLGATRDHTERMLRWFGVPVEIKDALVDGVPVRVVGLDGPAHLAAQDVSIPGDLSSAAFFIAAAALLPRSDLEIANLGINPTRALFLSLMRQVGADLIVENRHEECNEPVGDIRVCSANERPEAHQPIVIRGALIPQLIDELPILAVVGTQLAGGIEIRDAAELRFKETDRIATTVNNLRAMGAGVKEYEDGFVVEGQQRLEGAEINSHGDHRIAMAFTIAALVAEGESEISGVECVAVSFPEFFDLLDSVVER